MDNQPTLKPGDQQNNMTAPAPQPVPAPVAPPGAAAKYGVFRAVLDTLSAMKKNLVTYLVSVLIVFAVGILSGAIPATGLVAVLAVTVPAAHSFGIDTMVSVVTAVLVFVTAWFALAGAFMLSYTSLALYAGADGRRSGIGETLRESLRRIMRVVLAQILVVIVALWPYIAAIVVAIMGIGTIHGPSGAWLLLLPVAGIVWFVIALLRFALAPYVALFEPEVPVSKVLSRSNQLMLGSGQWFVVKGIGLIIIIAIVLSASSGSSLQHLSDSGTWYENLVFTVVSFVATGTLVLFYRNRKLVKG